MGIYGGSFGGYATLAGVAFTPDLYACGVDYVGISNIFSWLKAISPYWKPILEMLYEVTGDLEKDKELLEKASPIFEVEYMVKENEGHDFRNEENRLDFYRAMEEFLAKHLGGRVEEKTQE